MSKPKILLFDVETKPIKASVWGLWENNVSLDQIIEDWSVLAWAAKWLDDDKIMYMDQRKSKDYMNDKKILRGIWKLLDEADVVITQNGKSFDQRVVQARFIINGFNPPSTYRHLDIKQLAQKYFRFSSHKLEYMAKTLKTKHQKLKHKKFPGQELWNECLKGNQAAWKEMERYNKHDVLTLEDVYKKIEPWGVGMQFNAYTEDGQVICNCGSKEFSKNGHVYRNLGKYARYICKKCGAETFDRRNLLTSERRKSLRGLGNR